MRSAAASAVMALSNRKPDYDDKHPKTQNPQEILA